MRFLILILNINFKKLYKIDLLLKGDNYLKLFFNEFRALNLIKKPIRVNTVKSDKKIICNSASYILN